MSSSDDDGIVEITQKTILARATGLLEVLEKLEIPLDALDSDSSALGLIEATQISIMLDPKSKPTTRLKAARDLAHVRGLDKQTRIAETERQIRKIRDGLRERDAHTVDAEFAPEQGEKPSEIPENSRVEKKH